MNQPQAEPRPLSEDTRLIPLTQGQFALVDAADYEWLNLWKWHAQWSRYTHSFYAGTNIKNDSGKFRYRHMHRVILGLSTGNRLKGDHINRNTLDNRRCNLRICPFGENARNTKKRSNNTSGFKGVKWHKRIGKWQSSIRVNNKGIHLGYFLRAEDAYTAYCTAAVKYHGEFASFD